MNPGHVRASVQVRAPAQDVWAALTHWELQGEWMIRTTVRTLDGDGRGVGGRIEAFTGLGRVGFVDTMEITEWRPPNWCAVRHTGRVVRGSASFAIVEAVDDAEGSTLTWDEDLDIPGGAFGARCFALARPAITYPVLLSLKRFARLVEKRTAPGA
jgi:carbon monoxide dehydrogenase subunit G